MSARPKSMRLFVGVYPPLDVAERLLTRLDALELPNHRRTRPDQIHLTLLFMGKVRTAEVDGVTESVQRSVAGVPKMQLTATQLITLPKGGRPRLVAVETDAPPTLLEVQRRLARRLARHSRPDPVDRFLPHLTLCRFRGSVAYRLPQAAVESLSFDVMDVCLMSSLLRPSGAEHEELARAPLRD